MRLEDSEHLATGQPNLAPEADCGSEADMCRRNDRRLRLIDKKHLGGGLTEAEQREFALLQAEFEKRMDDACPPPRRLLDDLEKFVLAAEAEGATEESSR